MEASESESDERRLRKEKNKVEDVEWIRDTWKLRAGEITKDKKTVGRIREEGRFRAREKQRRRKWRLSRG
jgi:hypothetical protein